MIVVRNIFKLKFGGSKDAVALWKQGLEIAGGEGFPVGSTRILTDLVGPFYTLVMESTHESLGEYERSAKRLMESSSWKTWYAKVVPLTEGGYREVFVVVN
jgi:hypothetical protein